MANFMTFIKVWPLVLQLIDIVMQISAILKPTPKATTEALEFDAEVEVSPGVVFRRGEIVIKVPPAPPEPPREEA